ncbi:hypothetical protein L227DRAFT_579327 [Lentinus tigrinus ALCF2SS1-6]|uniref:RNase III domain-containing protein n=1 Tax=Lentinus tigrinus ALCF2SS1-6 TaxID=1328759 RepID=A0A5C2RXQ4_9APHY|nr:hypothetical protein L227DRAFT_579327 [Lentinus tigrinus ALCF2SS1-6]
MVQHAILQRAIERAINKPDYTASLPPLSEVTWKKLLEGTHQARAENDRLEFVGDALMYATLAPVLYAQYPNGTPHFYTCLRAVLHSNATFSSLAEKLDIMAVSNRVLQALTKRTFGEGALAPNKSKPEVKMTADMFETIIGAYYLENGFKALCEWVEEIYSPLIEVVAETFFAHQHGPYATYRGPGEKKRTMGPFIYKHGPLLSRPFVHPRQVRYSPSPKKQKVPLGTVRQRACVVEKVRIAHAGRTSPRPSVKQDLIGTSNPKPKAAPAKQPSKSSLSKNVTQSVKQAPIFIDLTVSSDSDDDCQPLVRHPLVTPRIQRPSPSVSKRPTPVRTFASSLPESPALIVNTVSSSESEDEMMLESMLIASDSGSDMDCGSSDVETPASPSKPMPLLSRTGFSGVPLDISQSTSHLHRTVFLC